MSDGYFGVCPICRDDGIMLNVHRDHWMVCDTHQVCWPIGSNLFSGWQYESEQNWTRNAQRLQGYKIVEPWYPPPEPTELTEEEKAELDHALLYWSGMSGKMQRLFLGKISDTEPF